MKKKIEAMIDHFGGIDETCAALGVTRMTLYRWRKSGQVPKSTLDEIATKYPQFDEFYWSDTQVVTLPAKLVSELISRGFDVHKSVTFRIKDGNTGEFKQ